MKRFILTLLFSSLIFCFLPIFNLSAQTTWTDIDTSSVENSGDSIPSSLEMRKPSVNLLFSPSNPTPNSPVTVIVESQSLSLNESTIFWYVNDKLITSGLGLKEINTKVGDIGGDTKVKVVVKSRGLEYTATETVSASELSIFYEAQTTTFPFYKGKRLPSKGSQIEFVAVTNLLGYDRKRIDDDNIVFTWRINGETNIQASGAGKNILYFKPENYTTEVMITVSIKVVNESITNKTIESFRFIKPLPIFYENSPSLGIFSNKDLSDKIMLNSDEIKIYISPFFFDKNALKDLRYEWYRGITKLNISDTANYIVFANEENTNGSAYFSVTINNLANPFIKATKITEVQYYKNNDSRF